MIKKIAILLGVLSNKMTCNVRRVKCNENRQKTTKFIKYLFLILLLALHFTPYTLHFTLFDGTAHALVISTNTANVDWIDDQGRSYITVDTAAIRILALPSLSIAKDVRNLRTGEISTDAVQAIRSDTVEFILSIVNSGDTEARDAVIVDSIPIGTEYVIGSASDTASNDPINAGQITFQHISGGEFDSSDTVPVTAIQWKWTTISGVDAYNKRVVKFRVKIKED